MGSFYDDGIYVYNIDSLTLVDDNTPSHDKNAVGLTAMSDGVIAYEKECFQIEKLFKYLKLLS